MKPELAGQSLARFPVVDYDGHPAFAALRVRTDADEALFDEICGATGELLRQCASAAESGDAAAAARRFADADRHFTRLEAELTRVLGDDAQLLGCAREALNATRAYLDGENAFEARRTSYSRGEPQGLEKALHADGFALVDLSPEGIAELRRHADPALDALAARSSVESAGRLTSKFPLDGELTRGVNRLVAEAGIGAAVSRYCGHDMQVDSVMVEYSHDRSTWYRDCYADAGLPTSRTAYMHCDYEYQRHKMTIYLQEAGAEHGPFTYVRGSHRLPRNRLQEVFFKELEQALGRARLSPAGAYYRPLLGVASARARFMRVPRALRGVGHFGDDLLDGLEVSRQLLAAEFPVTTDRGNCVVFDGHRGIHRGGQVVRGERRVLHVGFGQRLSLLVRVARRLKG